MSTGDDDTDPYADLPGEDGGIFAHYPLAIVNAAAYSDRYIDTWCGACGRRRGNDGRCAECDGWWTSPLIKYGVPIVASTTALLLLVVPQFRPKSEAYARRTVLSRMATSVPQRISHELLTVRVQNQPYVPPQVAPPAPPVPVLPPPTPSPDLVQLAQQARLRALTESADAAAVRSENARTWNGTIFIVPHAVAPSAVQRIPVQDRIVLPSPMPADPASGG